MLEIVSIKGQESGIESRYIRYEYCIASYLPITMLYEATSGLAPSFFVSCSNKRVVARSAASLVV